MNKPKSELYILISPTYKTNPEYISLKQDDKPAGIVPNKIPSLYSKCFNSKSALDDYIKSNQIQPDSIIIDFNNNSIIKLTTKIEISYSNIPVSKYFHIK